MQKQIHEFNQTGKIPEIVELAKIGVTIGEFFFELIKKAPNKEKRLQILEAFMQKDIVEKEELKQRLDNVEGLIKELLNR